MLYETELLDQFADTDTVRDFFARLDSQLNKVNQFYKQKEKEFVERRESLNKQTVIFLELKAAPRQQPERGLLGNHSKEDPSISCSIAPGEKMNFLLRVCVCVCVSLVKKKFGCWREENTCLDA